MRGLLFRSSSVHCACERLEHDNVAQGSMYKLIIVIIYTYIIEQALLKHIVTSAEDGRNILI